MQEMLRDSGLDEGATRQHLDQVGELKLKLKQEVKVEKALDDELQHERMVSEGLKAKVVKLNKLLTVQHKVLKAAHGKEETPETQEDDHNQESQPIGIDLALAAPSDSAAASVASE